MATEVMKKFDSHTEVSGTTLAQIRQHENHDVPTSTSALHTQSKAQGQQEKGPPGLMKFPSQLTSESSKENSPSQMSDTPPSLSNEGIFSGAHQEICLSRQTGSTSGDPGTLTPDASRISSFSQSIRKLSSVSFPSLTDHSKRGSSIKPIPELNDCSTCPNQEGIEMSQTNNVIAAPVLSPGTPEQSPAVSRKRKLELSKEQDDTRARKSSKRKPRRKHDQGKRSPSQEIHSARKNTGAGYQKTAFKEVVIGNLCMCVWFIQHTYII